MKAYKDPNHKARMAARRERQKARQGTPDDEVLRTWAAFWRAQHAKSIPGGERRKRKRALDALLAMDRELY